MLKSALVVLVLLSVACQKQIPIAAPAALPPSVAPNTTASRQTSEGTLQQRFSHLSCAIVTIANSMGSGTGFFINADGDVMTAAHVVFGRTYSRQPDGSVGITLTLPGQTISTSEGARVRVTTRAIVQRDIVLASFDLAVIHTDHHTDCFVEPNITGNTAIGQHVLSIGHPALSGSAVLFDGIH
ncbi:MAG: serine protease [Bryobacteraceae bacterium]